MTNTNKTTTRTISAAPSIEDELDTAVETAAEDEVRASSTRASNKRNAFGNNKNKRLAKSESRLKRYLDIIDRPKLDIPDAVRERFLDEGFELRWIAYKVGRNGADDIANVNRKKQLGYTFVQVHEVPELTGMRNVTHDTFGGLITLDELALAKISIEDANDYREALNIKMNNASQGIVSALNDSKVKRFLKQDPFDNE